ncbi:MAG: TatD family deoxyribonuclease [Ignavibacteria bacterium]|nr:TatD family deoxyribonuclease [Ignavibacteria bacterium]
MIDTHAHIDTEKFDDDRQDMLQRAIDAGVEKIIMPAIEMKGFENLQQLAASNELLYCGIGVHPHHANEVDGKVLAEIEERSHRTRTVAIGEIGLDYFYDFTTPEVQKKVFSQQIDIAVARNLPMIIHNRKADEDVMDILTGFKSASLSGVLHCFSGSPDMAQKALDLGFHISFTGNITFKKSTLSEVVSIVPMDRLLLETDSPYMAPPPYRGKRNEPANLKMIAEKIAEIKKINIEEVISMTTQNAKKLFKLILIIILFLSLGTEISAQNIKTKNREAISLDEGDSLFNPYKKFLGFGGVIAFNTIVDNIYKPDNTEVSQSWDGILAYGGDVLYSPYDYLILEFTYLYSVNKKIVEEHRKNNWGERPPIYFTFYELSSIWIANPYGRINLFFSGGLSIITIDDAGKKNLMGFNTGLGFISNINTSFGLICPSMEWRLDFHFNRTEIFFQDNKTKLEAWSWYSLPRFSIKYFPNL